MSNLNKINAEQKIVMAEFMSRHQDLAKNILPNCQQGKATSIRLWQQLAENLNSIGPPIKDVKGWRKTFADQKYQVKTKLSFNKYSKMKTGGGRYEEKVLTAADELILSATGLDVAVEGIEVKNFGAFTPCIQTAPGPSNAQLPSTQLNASTQNCPIASTSTANDPTAASYDPSAASSYDFNSIEFLEVDHLPLTSTENRPRKFSKKVDEKLSLLKEKISLETSHNESISMKLDKLLEIEERNIGIQERLLAIKEEKHQAFMQMHEIDLQIKNLKLESLINNF